MLARSVPLLFAVLAVAAAQPNGGYTGTAVCAKCHPAIQHESIQSRHSKVMQPATKQSVVADFSQGKLLLRGSTYGLGQRDGQYFITESDVAGKPVERKIEFTLGGRRIQHYLTTLPDGRIILIPAAWDNVQKKWIHDTDSGNPEENNGDPIIAWNKTCFGCHVSREQKNFDVVNLRYRTTWQELGVNCESCHGPGSRHAGSPRTVPLKLDAARSTMVCASCHSLRDMYAEGFSGGADYYDYFLPVMEFRLPPGDDSAYWEDGRPRWLSNEATALWQSQCFLKGGATCMTCHSAPHTVDIERNTQLKPANNAQCAGCHEQIASDVSKHSHHPVASSSCVDCHMPKTVISLGTSMRDHSLSIPAPDNKNISNACNSCHRDKDAGWAATAMTGWYGSKGREKMLRRARAFTQAKARNSSAIPLLLSIAADPSGGPVTRANAVGYLGGFPNDPSAYESVLAAFKDPEPLVRATALTALRPSPGQREAAATEMLGLLKDPLRTVRISAGIALVAIGLKPFPGEDGARFEEAKRLYRARAELYNDDAGQQFAAGRFFILAGDMDNAISAFRASLKLDPRTPAQYPLAQTLAAKGDYPAARQILAVIPRNDPRYQAAQQLLAEMDAKDIGPTQAHFAEGQVLFRSGYYGSALKNFELALKAAPQAEWAVKARIFRAICLEKLSRTEEAEAAIKQLSGESAGSKDIDLQLAFVELLSDTGRAGEARKRIDELIATASDAPMAHFWRAKVMLQLERPDDAAKSAEDAIRLLPEFPQAHNLLIRLYQMQGRSKEAAQQAEWLRDYQRSH